MIKKILVKIKHNLNFSLSKLYKRIRILFIYIVTKQIKNGKNNDRT